MKNIDGRIARLSATMLSACLLIVVPETSSAFAFSCTGPTSQTTLAGYSTLYECDETSTDRLYYLTSINNHIDQLITDMFITVSGNPTSVGYFDDGLGGVWDAEEVSAFFIDENMWNTGEIVRDDLTDLDGVDGNRRTGTFLTEEYGTFSDVFGIDSTYALWMTSFATEGNGVLFNVAQGGVGQHSIFYATDVEIASEFAMLDKDGNIVDESLSYSQAVPEPATIYLLLIGLFPVVRSRINVVANHNSNETTPFRTNTATA